MVGALEAINCGTLKINELLQLLNPTPSNYYKLHELRSRWYLENITI